MIFNQPCDTTGTCRVGSDARQHSHIDALIAALAGSDGARAGSSNDGLSPPQVQQAAGVQQAGATGPLPATPNDRCCRNMLCMYDL